MGTHDREREKYVRDYVMVEQAALRRRMEAAIDSMLALLDELDGDPDLEASNDDEPSLGWCDGKSSFRWGGGDDREAEDEHDEDGGDSEPSLGAPDRATLFDGWVSSVDGGGYSAVCSFSQVGWAAGGASDLEEGDDNGIADAGGLQEQWGGHL